MAAGDNKDVKSRLNELYQTYLGRLPSDEEVTAWATWAETNAPISERGDKSEPYVALSDSMFREAAKSELGQSQIVKDKIAGLYRTNLGREARPDEIAGWQKSLESGEYNLATMNDAFSNASDDEITGRVTKLGTDLMSGAIPGYNYEQQSAEVEKQYAEAGTEMRNTLAENAAGGGFDTGGYYTSMAKGESSLKSAKITTLAEMNEALSTMKMNMSLQGASLLSGLQEKKLSLEQYNEQMAQYNKEMTDYRSALAKNQAEWWKPALANIAGTAVGIYTGNVAAGLAAKTLADKALPVTQVGQAPTTPVAQTAGTGYYPGLKKNYFAGAYGENTGNYGGYY